MAESGDPGIRRPVRIVVVLVVAIALVLLAFRFIVTPGAELALG